MFVQLFYSADLCHDVIVKNFSSFFLKALSIHVTSDLCIAKYGLWLLGEGWTDVCVLMCSVSDLCVLCTTALFSSFA